MNSFDITMLVYLNFSPFWNFGVPTNVIVYERKPSLAPQPHPDIEQLRSQLLERMRIQYTEMCQSREGMQTTAGVYC